MIDEISLFTWYVSSSLHNTSFFIFRENELRAAEASKKEKKKKDEEQQRALEEQEMREAQEVNDVRNNHDQNSNGPNAIRNHFDEKDEEDIDSPTAPLYNKNNANASSFPDIRIIPTPHADNGETRNSTSLLNRSRSEQMHFETGLWKSAVSANFQTQHYLICFTSNMSHLLEVLFIGMMLSEFSDWYRDYRIWYRDPDFVILTWHTMLSAYRMRVKPFVGSSTVYLILTRCKNSSCLKIRWQTLKCRQSVCHIWTLLVLVWECSHNPCLILPKEA